MSEHFSTDLGSSHTRPKAPGAATGTQCAYSELVRRIRTRTKDRFYDLGTISADEVKSLLLQAAIAIEHLSPGRYDSATPDADKLIADEARKLSHQFYNGGIRSSLDIGSFWAYVRATDNGDISPAPAINHNEPDIARLLALATGEGGDACASVHHSADQADIPEWAHLVVKIFATR